MSVKYDKQTPVGYVAYCNKLKCLEEISSVPGVDLTLGVCSSPLPPLSSPSIFLFRPFLSSIPLILNTLAQYGNGIIKLSTGCKYFEGRRRILAQYGNGITKLPTVCKYFEGRRRILAQYGNGIIQLSTGSKYFGRKKKNTCTIWQWNNPIIHSM